MRGKFSAHGKGLAKDSCLNNAARKGKSVQTQFLFFWMMKGKNIKPL